jgi:hypothetical protein
MKKTLFILALVAAAAAGTEAFGATPPALSITYAPPACTCPSGFTLTLGQNKNEYTVQCVKYMQANKKAAR